ncbi:MAG TPA: 2,5-didehydrogluconate reductase B [Acetobacteraceae bacterium]|jgi:2,5-diketo-D-gluconate reductase B|nr:2,5-didehydrogluconate reductase B [Acetobacteraceae bacterium]
MDMITAHGLRMPRLGLGTFRMTGAVCQEAVESALELGYRHIDTGQMYGNQDAVGDGWVASGVDRAAFHLTSKGHHSIQTPDEFRAACEESLRLLRTDYLDLYMLHWPRPGTDLPAALETLMRLQEQGLVRKIGVANCTISHLKVAIEEVRAPIVANQIEYHVMIDQGPVLNYMRAHDLPVVAHVPLAQGRLADNEVLATIGRRYGIGAAQVALAWLLDQPDVAVIPKAARRESQLANMEATKLKLDDADKVTIAAMPKNVRCVNPPFAPAWDSVG